MRVSDIGIVLINSGTAERPDEESIRVYLSSMLSDPMLVSCPRFIWKRVLKYCILPNRPKKTIWKYERMWDEDGSIFMRVSRSQEKAFREELARRDFNDGAFEVRLAMRYSAPSVASQVDSLKEAGCDELAVIPLYPQYVNVCAGTCIKEFRRCVDELRDESWDPSIVEVRQFYDQKPYQEALAASVRRCWEYTPGSKLCVSLHSTPMSDIKAGDPYHEQNLATTRDLARRLGMDEGDCQLTYQSRFDSRSWLGPFTNDVIEEWAVAGVEDVCMVCPGFVAENLESKVEAGEEMRDMFLTRAGEGASFTYVPTLDDDPGLIAAMADALEDARRGA